MNFGKSVHVFISNLILTSFSLNLKIKLERVALVVAIKISHGFRHRLVHQARCAVFESNESLKPLKLISKEFGCFSCISFGPLIEKIFFHQLIIV